MGIGNKKTKKTVWKWGNAAGMVDIFFFFNQLSWK